MPTSLHKEALCSTGLYIDGLSRPAEGGRRYELFNPARPDELVGHAALASTNDVDHAVQSAHDAFAAWSRKSYAERAALLHRIADELNTDEDDINRRSRIFCREHGKILLETKLELTRLSDRFQSVADYADRLSQDKKEYGPPFDTIITRQPRGVATLIVPWNWPLSILGAKLPQALMAGNTVVVKSSQSSALTPTLTLEKIAALLPPGVLNVVTGRASEIGDHLVGHSLVRYVNFTGSVPIGKHIMRIAAENVTPVTLELGGNDAGIICDDATLDEAALRKIYLGAFMSTGQICMALKRLYVHRSRYEELREGLTSICKQIVVGDGLLAETNMGPLNNKAQLQIVRDMISEARSAGAEVSELGLVPDKDLYRQGYFQKPTLVFNPAPSLDVVCKEQFGPVLPIIPFDTESEAIRMANQSHFGLCSSVWTEDRDRAERIARELEAGYTYVNGHGPTAQDNRAPFGGFKQSGIGRNLGYEGVIQFQAYQSISGEAGWFLPL